jgi:hypothetical protein
MSRLSRVLRERPFVSIASCAASHSTSRSGSRGVGRPLSRQHRAGRSVARQSGNPAESIWATTGGATTRDKTDFFCRI